MQTPARSRLLCVEDDEDTCFMLSYLLRGPDREVVSAATVEAARAEMNAARFDLYVLDVGMRGGKFSGLDFCREVVRRDPWAKVIFYTGAASEADRAAGMAAGAGAYVVKPEIKELARAVERLLSSSPPESKPKLPSDR